MNTQENADSKIVSLSPQYPLELIGFDGLTYTYRTHCCDNLDPHSGFYLTAQKINGELKCGQNAIEGGIVYDIPLNYGVANAATQSNFLPQEIQRCSQSTRPALPNKVVVNIEPSVNNQIDEPHEHDDSQNYIDDRIYDRITRPNPQNPCQYIAVKLFDSRGCARWFTLAGLTYRFLNSLFLVPFLFQPRTTRDITLNGQTLSPAKAFNKDARADIDTTIPMDFTADIFSVVTIPAIESVLSERITISPRCIVINRIFD